MEWSRGNRGGSVVPEVVMVLGTLAILYCAVEQLPWWGMVAGALYGIGAGMWIVLHWYDT